MNIQFQAENGTGSFISDDFGDEKSFLNSLSMNLDFTVYKPSTQEKSEDKISIKPVLKRLVIQTMKPFHKGNSPYFEFTAKKKKWL